MVGAGIPVAEHVKLPLVDSSKVNVVFSDGKTIRGTSVIQKKLSKTNKHNWIVCYHAASLTHHSLSV